MASISVSEAEFGALVGAVMRAHVKGDFADARTLDKLARKANAALSTSKNSAVPKGFRSAKPLTWHDVPSPLATFRGIITPRPVKASRAARPRKGG